MIINKYVEMKITKIKIIRHVTVYLYNHPEMLIFINTKRQKIMYLLHYTFFNNTVITIICRIVFMKLMPKDGFKDKLNYYVNSDLCNSK